MFLKVRIFQDVFSLPIFPYHDVLKIDHNSVITGQWKMTVNVASYYPGDYEYFFLKDTFFVIGLAKNKK